MIGETEKGKIEELKRLFYLDMQGLIIGHEGQLTFDAIADICEIHTELIKDIYEVHTAKKD